MTDLGAVGGAERFFTSPRPIMQLDLSGFRDDEERRGDNMLRRRMIDMEKEIVMMKERVGVLEKTVVTLITEKDVWKNAYDDIQKKIILNEGKMEESVKKVNELDEKQKVWKKEQEEDCVNFKKVVDEQVKLKDESITEKVAKVIKQKEGIIRDTVEKKAIVIHGLKEEFIPIRHNREKKDKALVDEVLVKVQENKDSLVN